MNVTRVLRAQPSGETVAELPPEARRAEVDEPAEPAANDLQRADPAEPAADAPEPVTAHTDAAIADEAEAATAPALQPEDPPPPDKDDTWWGVLKALPSNDIVAELPSAPPSDPASLALFAVPDDYEVRPVAAEALPAAEPAAAPVVIEPRPAQPVKEDPWEALSTVESSPRRLRRKRIYAVYDNGPARAAVDMLRTKILGTMHANGWSSLAIVGPRRGCGVTTTAVNLAYSFANLKHLRTVLLDLNLREPGVHSALGVERGTLAPFFQGQQHISHTFVRLRSNLAVGLSVKPFRNAAELLVTPASERALDGLRQTLKPDILIYDLPPVLDFGDALAFFPKVDCAILVAGAEQSRAADIDRSERLVSEHTNLLGVVLNKCRYPL